jgi:hypothetical protein
MTLQIYDVVRSARKVLPPYAVCRPAPQYREWPGLAHAHTIEPDVVRALVELPDVADTGRDYAGLATECNDRGEVTLWRCSPRRRTRIWQAIEW